MMRAPDNAPGKSTTGLSQKQIKWLTENPDRCEEFINALIEAWECANEPQIPKDEDVDPEYEMWLEEQIHQNWAAIARATLPTRTEVRQAYILGAIEDGDDEWLNALVAANPKLAAFALKARTRFKRNRGRQKNDRRNLEPYMRDLMAGTHKYVRLVRAACWRLLGKRNPPKPLTAIGIACKYKGVNEDQYLNWCKNQSKYRRNKRRIARPR
jgi:hypothetical protein